MLWKQNYGLLAKFLACVTHLFITFWQQALMLIAAAVV